MSGHILFILMTSTLKCFTFYFYASTVKNRKYAQGQIFGHSVHGGGKKTFAFYGQFPFDRYQIQKPDIF